MIKKISTRIRTHQKEIKVENILDIDSSNNVLSLIKEWAT